MVFSSLYEASSSGAIIKLLDAGAVNGPEVSESALQQAV